MSLDRLCVSFSFVKNVHLFFVSDENLEWYIINNLGWIDDVRVGLTPNALTLVFPPSANEPGAAERAVSTQVKERIRQKTPVKVGIHGKRRESKQKRREV